MKKTPQEFRRESVKKIFNKILQSQTIKLEPFDINVAESCKEDFTTVDLSFKERVSDVVVSNHLVDSRAKGFVDGIFRTCSEHYSKTYTSLQNIKLVNYQARPIFAHIEQTIGSEAKVEVGIVVKVKNHGTAEFYNQSRSILHSSFVNILSAFEFYINCERAFDKIQVILEDAKNRNRSDIADSCRYDLSILTEANTYVRKKKN